MSKPIGEVEGIKERFTDEYMLGDKNRNQYILAVGISKVSLRNPNASKSELDDLCINVFVRDDISFPLEIPGEYYGVKVFVEKSSRVRTL